MGWYRLSNQEKEPQKTPSKKKISLMKRTPVAVQTTMLYKRYTAEFKGITVNYHMEF